jgi:hypothetical protein
MSKHNEQQDVEKPTQAQTQDSEQPATNVSGQSADANTQYLQSQQIDTNAQRECNFGPFHVRRLTTDAVAKYDGRVDAQAYVDVTDVEVMAHGGASTTIVCRHGDSEYRQLYYSAYEHAIDSTAYRVLLDGADSAFDQFRTRLTNAMATYATMTAQAWSSVALARRLHSHQRRDYLIGQFLDPANPHDRVNVVDAWQAANTIAQPYLATWMGALHAQANHAVDARLLIRVCDVLACVLHYLNNAGGHTSIDADGNPLVDWQDLPGVQVVGISNDGRSALGHMDGVPTPCPIVYADANDADTPAEVVQFLFNDGDLPAHTEWWVTAGERQQRNPFIGPTPAHLADLITDVRHTNFTVTEAGLLQVAQIPAGTQPTAINLLAHEQFDALVRYETFALLSASSTHYTDADGREYTIFDRSVLLGAVATLTTILGVAGVFNNNALANNWTLVLAQYFQGADQQMSATEQIAQRVLNPETVVFDDNGAPHPAADTTQHAQADPTRVHVTEQWNGGAYSGAVITVRNGQQQQTIESMALHLTISAIDSNRYTHSRAMYYATNEMATRWLHLQTHALLAGYTRSRIALPDTNIPLHIAGLYTATHIWLNSISGSDFKRMPDDIAAGIVAIRNANPSTHYFPTVDDTVVYSANTAVITAEMKTTDTVGRADVLDRNLHTLHLHPWGAMTAHNAQYDEQKFMYAHQAVDSLLREIPNNELVKVDANAQAGGLVNNLIQWITELTNRLDLARLNTAQADVVSIAIPDWTYCDLVDRLIRIAATSDDVLQSTIGGTYAGTFSVPANNAASDTIRSIASTVAVTNLLVDISQRAERIAVAEILRALGWFVRLVQLAQEGKSEGLLVAGHALRDDYTTKAVLPRLESSMSLVADAFDYDLSSELWREYKAATTLEQLLACVPALVHYSTDILNNDFTYADIVLRAGQLLNVTNIHALLTNQDWDVVGKVAERFISASSTKPILYYMLSFKRGAAVHTPTMQATFDDQWLTNFRRKPLETLVVDQEFRNLVNANTVLVQPGMRQSFFDFTLQFDAVHPETVVQPADGSEIVQALEAAVITRLNLENEFNAIVRPVSAYSNSALAAAIPVVRRILSAVVAPDNADYLADYSLHLSAHTLRPNTPVTVSELLQALGLDPMMRYSAEQLAYVHRALTAYYSTSQQRLFNLMPIQPQQAGTLLDILVLSAQFQATAIATFYTYDRLVDVASSIIVRFPRMSRKMLCRHDPVIGFVNAHIPAIQVYCNVAYQTGWWQYMNEQTVQKMKEDVFSAVIKAIGL